MLFTVLLINEADTWLTKHYNLRKLSVLPNFRPMSVENHTSSECTQTHTRIRRSMMIREIISNKWILGAVLLLIIVVGGCYFFYQYTTAEQKKEASETAEFVRQWEKDRQAQPKRSTEIEQASDGNVVGSDMPSVERKRTETTLVTKDIEPSQAQTRMSTGTQVQNAKTEEVRVSRYGFGPYPEVPEDMPYRHHHTTWEEDTLEAELLSRVLIKLWTSGERNFIGGSTHNGKILPHYHDTVYVHFREYEKRGKTIRFAATSISGPHVRYTEADLLNPPPHLRVLDLDSSGIDPYQFLDLP